MASFSKGTSFNDGVTGDVTAAKLHALVDAATPVPGFITDRTAETSIATDDLVLISNTSDSGALNKMTVANLMKAELTGTINSTAGTIATLNSTTGVIPTLTSTTLITSGTGTAAAPAIVPTGDTNTGAFFPAADTVAISTQGTERVRVDSDGNVGISVSSPSSKLHIVGTVSNQIVVGNNTNNNANKVSVYNGAHYTNSEEPVLIVGSSTTSTANDVFIGGAANTSNAATSVLFYTATNSTTVTGTERMRIDSTGNVLIGTDVNASTQGGKLQVITDSVIRRNAASTGGAALRIEKSRSATDGGYTIVQNGDTIGDIQFYGSDGVDFAQAASIRGIVDGTPGSNDMPGALLFLTSADGSQTPTERMRIDSSGYVSIGTATGLSALHVHGNITLSNTTTATSAGTSTITPPSTVAGYLTVSINGTSRKIPYYAT